MPKVNIYLPDDLADAVKDAGVPVSAVCQRALEQAVRRVTALREVATQPLAIDAESGPYAVTFTRRAAKVLQSAQRQPGADAAGVGTEHLLLAIVAADTMAVRVLSALEIAPRQVRTELQSRARHEQELVADPDVGAEVRGRQRLSAETARVIELAANESSALGNGYVGTEHLLLGLIGEPDGVAGSVLRSLGADLRMTRRTVAAALAGWGAGVAAHEERTSGQADAPQTGLIATHVAAAIKSELAPVLARIERLEILTAS